MDFRATPVNVVVLLLVALFVYVLNVLSKQKLDSNIPLLYYACLGALMNFTDRSVNPYLFGAGFSLALMLRFEFMNRAFTKFVLAAEIAALCSISAIFMTDIFNIQLDLSRLRF